MKFSTLVLQGDKEKERLKKEFLYSKYFHITRMLSELLKGIELDGSGKVGVVAKPSPNGEKYDRCEFFKVSIYYLEEDEIDLIKNAAKGNEDSTVLQILTNALLDIAEKNNCDESVRKKIQDASDFIVENKYVISEKIKKFSKRSATYSVSANVYRTFSKELGEGWSIRLLDSARNEIYAESMVEIPSFIDSINNHFAKAAWEDKKYVVVDRFGRESYSLDISSIRSL